MKQVYRASIILFTTILTTSLTHASERMISDSLVTNLECSQLKSASAIYNYITPSKLYNSDKIIPKSNWTWSFMGGAMANCWGLSRIERRLMYLARLNPGRETTNLNTEQWLNFLRDSTPEEYFTSSKGGIKKPREIKLQQLPIIEIPGDSFRSYEAYQSIWLPLKKGLSTNYQEIPNTQRTLETEITQHQASRFFKMSNINHVITNTALNPDYNQMIIERIKISIDQNRLPLLVIRFGAATQHVIIPTRYKTFEDRTYLYVYDSNNPFFTSRGLIYNHTTKTFTAEDLLKDWVELKNPEDAKRPVSIAIEDEDDFDMIDEALWNYYQEKCSE